jgi:thioredoxin-like negative regulator of GroEL
MLKNSSTPIKPKSARLFPRLLILVGLVALVTAIFLIKNQSSRIVASVTESPEAQFDRYMEEQKPVFAFFHSTNCRSCIDMMAIVAEVYPEFKGSVEIIDVDVYDSRNDDLLRRAGIRSIPTLIFFNRQGQGKASIGVMEADQLRQELTILKESQ